MILRFIFVLMSISPLSIYGMDLCEQTDAIKSESKKLSELRRQYLNTENSVMKCGTFLAGGEYRRFTGNNCRYYLGAGLGTKTSYTLAAVGSFAACVTLEKVIAKKLKLPKNRDLDLSRIICPTIGTALGGMSIQEGSQRLGMARERMFAKMSAEHLVGEKDIRKELAIFRRLMKEDLSNHQKAIKSLDTKSEDYKTRKSEIGESLVAAEINLFATAQVLEEIATECEKPAEALGSVANAPAQALQ